MLFREFQIYPTRKLPHTRSTNLGSRRLMLVFPELIYLWFPLLLETVRGIEANLAKALVPGILSAYKCCSHLALTLPPFGPSIGLVGFSPVSCLPLLFPFLLPSSTNHCTQSFLPWVRSVRRSHFPVQSFPLVFFWLQSHPKKTTRSGHTLLQIQVSACPQKMYCGDCI